MWTTFPPADFNTDLLFITKKPISTVMNIMFLKQV